MKLWTHYVFTLGLLIFVDSLLLRSHVAAFGLSLAVSFFANSLIDGLGHKEIHTPKGTIPARTPLTHTFPRSVVWGVVASLPAVLFLPFVHYSYYDYSYYYYDGYYGLNGSLILVALLDGALAGPSHLFLDMFTEKGIYVKKGGKWRRFALAHFKYDDPAANMLAAAAGVFLIFAAAAVA